MAPVSPRLRPIAAYLIGLDKTAEIAEARAQLLRMLDGLGPLAWLLKPDGTVIHANRTAGAVLNRPRGADRRPPVLGPAAARRPRMRASSAPVRPSDRAARGDDSRFDLILTDEDDAQRVFDLWIRPLDSAHGRPTDLVASAVDITGRYESEQTQRLLMRELDHRIKNTLQVIQAVIRRTAGRNLPSRFSSGACSDGSAPCRAPMTCSPRNAGWAPR